jgi:hypothetical protein
MATLLWASSKGERETVQWLLRMGGANIAAADNEGTTALFQQHVFSFMS